MNKKISEVGFLYKGKQNYQNHLQVINYIPNLIYMQKNSSETFKLYSWLQEKFNQDLLFPFNWGGKIIENVRKVLELHVPGKDLFPELCNFEFHMSLFEKIKVVYYNSVSEFKRKMYSVISYFVVSVSVFWAITED